MDKVGQIRQEYRNSEWARQVAQCRSSGKSVKEWCQENSINRKTYYYRQRAVQEQLCENFADPKQTIIPICMTAKIVKTGAAITMNVGNARIEIPDGTSGETISDVIRALLQNSNAE